MTDKKLIIIRGNSGSGKSSVAKALQREFGRGTLVISQDTVRREMLHAHDGFDNKAIPLLCDLLRYGHENCSITILEGILNSEWYKPLFETAMKLYGDNIFAYYYDIPFEETLRRHETKSGVNFGEEHMRKWWNEKDYIGFIHEETITEEASVGDVVNHVKEQLKRTVNKENI